MYCSEKYETFIKLYTESGSCDSEWFGGAYIGGSGELCVKYVAGLMRESLKDELSRMMGEAIRFEEARYSLRSLTEFSSEVLNVRGVFGAGVDVENNTVAVTVNEELRDNLPAEKFSLCRLDWIKPDAAEVTVHPAERLSNGKCFFSAGYPARNEKKIRGIVTAGHISELTVGARITAGGTEIGYVYNFEYSETADMAFIALTDGSRSSHEIPIAPNPVVKKLAPVFISGAAVEMYSAGSKNVHRGKVAYPMFDFMNNKGIVIFTYPASAGDSGSPVLIPLTPGNYGLVGIHLGSLSMDGRIYSYGRAAKQINRQFSLELV